MFTSLQSLFQTQSPTDACNIVFSNTGEAPSPTLRPSEDASHVSQIQEQGLQQLKRAHETPSLSPTASNSNTSVTVESNGKHAKFLKKEPFSSKPNSFLEDYSDNNKHSPHVFSQQTPSCGLSDIFGSPQLTTNGRQRWSTPPIGASARYRRQRSETTSSNRSVSGLRCGTPPGRGLGAKQYAVSPLVAPIHSAFETGSHGETLSSVPSKSKNGESSTRGDTLSDLFIPKPSISTHHLSNKRKLKKPTDLPARAVNANTSIPKVKCNECYKWKDLWRTSGKELDANRKLHSKYLEEIETFKSTNIKLIDDIDQKKQQILVGESEIKSLKKEIAEIKNDVQLQQNELRTRYENKLKGKSDEIEVLNTSIRDRSRELTTLNEAFKDSKAESQKQAEEFNVKLEEMQNNNKIILDKYKKLEQTFQETEDRETGIREELEKKIKKYESRITVLTSEFWDSKRRLVVLEEAAVEREKDLREDLSEAQNSLKWQKTEELEKSQAFEAELTRLEAELDAQVEENGKYQTIIAEQTRQQTKLEAEESAQRSKLEQADIFIAKLETRHSSQIEKLNVNLAAAHSAMEDRCLKIVKLQDELENAKSELELCEFDMGKLKAESDMANFSLKLKSRKIEKLEGKLDSRVTEMRTKGISEQQFYDMQIVQLKAQISSIYSELEQRVNEKEELRVKNKKLHLEVAELKEELESSSLKVLELQGELESSNLKSSRQSTSIVEQNDKLGVVNSELKRCRDEMSKLKAQNEKANSNLNLKSDEMLTLEAKLNKLKTRFSAEQKQSAVARTKLRTRAWSSDSKLQLHGDNVAELNPCIRKLRFEHTEPKGELESENSPLNKQSIEIPDRYDRKKRGKCILQQFELEDAGLKADFR